jgi:hypothetical protein
MTWIAPPGGICKSFLEKTLEKFELAIPARFARDLSQLHLVDESSIGRG